ncbi:MAG: vitamin B12-dependent ribonucleotide reductase [Patescibacteria group bacterium]|nr:vitamin B12-dependent ribonucleotide reductase [Patescibacteria group bacterium]
MSPIKKIQKRDGHIAEFDQGKITEAIWKAVQSVGGTDRKQAEMISNQVTAVLEVFFKDENDIPNVEQIQDLVEKILIEGGHAKTAKSYIIYRQKRAEERLQREMILGKEMADKNLNFSMNALQVLERRYLLKNEKGELKETPEDLIRRVASAIAAEDEKYGENADDTEEKFCKMMGNLEFLPNSPTLMNAGTELGQLSACFVLPVGDSMEAIFDALKQAALIHKSGGGTGFSFSRLRPSNDIVRSTTGVSSGPISFMKVFDAATEVIKQGGKRRGANMGILRIDHPDIIDFVQMKNDMSTLTNFNISVGVTDKFMEALGKGSEYELINPRDGKPVKSIPARMVFDVILANAWKNGDPGLIFIDEINKHNVVKHLGDIEATNPCGEQPLLGYESCNLGSINLNKAVKEDEAEMDWDKLREIVHTATHFLDNVIDANHYPIPEIAEQSRKTRKIGLGIMGFADVLYQLGIPYNSDEGVKMGEKIMKFVRDEAMEKSIDMAKTRGVFPAWEGSEHEKTSRKCRNACVTTVAPTGTIGMLAEASGGLEPNFALAFIKNVMDGTELIYTNQFFEKELKKRNLYSTDLMHKVTHTGSIQNIERLPEDIKRVFVTAQDITPEWHIRMQAAFQKHVDSSVSKTINFPQNASIEDVERSYWLAYKLKCKGITIYRDKSREGQVLNIGEVNKREQKEPKVREVIPPPILVLENRERPKNLPVKKELFESKECPECKGTLQLSEGCILCLNCGFSACTV